MRLAAIAIGLMGLAWWAGVSGAAVGAEGGHERDFFELTRLPRAYAGRGESYVELADGTRKVASRYEFRVAREWVECRRYSPRAGGTAWNLTEVERGVGDHAMMYHVENSRAGINDRMKRTGMSSFDNVISPMGWLRAMNKAVENGRSVEETRREGVVEYSLTLLENKACRVEIEEATGRVLRVSGEFPSSKWYVEFSDWQSLGNGMEAPRRIKKWDSGMAQWRTGARPEDVMEVVGKYFVLDELELTDEDDLPAEIEMPGETIVRDDPKGVIRKASGGVMGPIPDGGSMGINDERARPRWMRSPSTWMAAGGVGVLLVAAWVWKRRGGVSA